jgi:hypothetical protein
MCLYLRQSHHREIEQKMLLKEIKAPKELVLSDHLMHHEDTHRCNEEKAGIGSS